jgi:hypothetical protein
MGRIADRLRTIRRTTSNKQAIKKTSQEVATCSNYGETLVSVLFFFARGLGSSPFLDSHIVLRNEDVAMVHSKHMRHRV